MSRMSATRLGEIEDKLTQIPRDTATWAQQMAGIADELADALVYERRISEWLADIVTGDWGGTVEQTIADAEQAIGKDAA